MLLHCSSVGLLQVALRKMPLKSLS